MSLSLLFSRCVGQGEGLGEGQGDRCETDDGDDGAEAMAGIERKSRVTY